MKRFLLTILLFVFFLHVGYLSFSYSVAAQVQGTPFSANDQSCSSYQCLNSSDTPEYDSNLQLCMCGDEKAILKPPALQQLEVWFVRIIYVIWAFVASFSFLMLVYLGYQWILTRGDVTKITTIRQRIVNFVIGIVLTFTALPILTTTFRLLGVNGEVACYNFDTLPRFQFFFPELCTDPKGIIVSNPCNFSGPSAEGFACSVPGEIHECELDQSNRTFFYECTNDFVWIRRSIVSPNP